MMRRGLFSAALIGGNTLLVDAQPAADEVTSLPDFGAPPSKHYSGYIEGNQGSQLHYYMATAENGNASEAPVIYWTNGGPGCSSMEGWGYEQGPFRFRSVGENDDSYPFANKTMKKNQFAWNKKYNVVFVEQPPGVGFSYMPNGGSYATDDTMNAKNNYAAIKSLFKKFSNFANNDFYLAGESYAGRYIPLMAKEILNGDDEHLKTQLKGMLVGNGVTATAEQGGPDSMVGESVLQTYYQGLTSFNQRTTAPYPFAINNLNPYGMQKNCYNPSDRRQAAAEDFKVDGIRSNERQLKDAYLRGTTGKPSPVTQKRQKDVADSDKPPPVTHLTCDDDVTLAAYLNRADVKAALHVKDYPYATCYEVPFSMNVDNVIPTYNAMAAAGKKVLIYSGASDGAVPWTTQATWIPKHTDWEVTREMTVWDFEDASFPYGPQVAGSAMQFQGKDQNNKAEGIWFTTMRGCGHMVPADCPASAAEMVDRVISGQFWDEPAWQETPYRLEDPVSTCSGNNKQDL